MGKRKKPSPQKGFALIVILAVMAIIAMMMILGMTVWQVSSPFRLLQESTPSGNIRTESGDIQPGAGIPGVNVIQKKLKSLPTITSNRPQMPPD